MDWTPERDARLTALWNQSDPVLSATLIGSMMGAISKNSVLGRAHRLKLPTRGDPMKPRKLEQPRRAGKSTLQIIPPRSRVVADTRTMDQLWLDGVAEPPPPWPARVDRLPIPVGPYGPARECQWPTSAGRPWTFCGCATVPGRSYCAEHTARAFNAVGVRDVPSEPPKPVGRVGMNARSWA